MKKTISNTLVVSSLFLSFTAFAGIDFPHVDSYDMSNEALFKDVKADTVPNALLVRSTIDNPRMSYSSLFPKSFLQDDLFAVCYQDCRKKDLVKVSDSSVEAKDRDALEQANVYFWLHRYFNFIEERFNFRLTKHLKVMTNRAIKDPTAGSKMKNNAFFNPADTTLSFLPASNSFFYNAMNGKINRSGYDPSVITHEASHYFFQHLFPDAINYEISGLNEGFADYIAHIHLENPKVGLIMLRGKALRDSSLLTDNDGKLKSYSPNLEAHDLGERVATVLWQSRLLSDNKEEFDRMVIDSVLAISQNPFATAHSFKTEFLKRVSTVVPADKMSQLNVFWEMLFKGQEAKVSDTSFLSKPGRATAYLGFKISQTIAKKFADEMGMDEQSHLGFAFIRSVDLPNKQTALLMASEDEAITTPYWYVTDDQTGNILAIYRLDHTPVTDKAELKNIEELTSQVASQKETVKEFINKARMFTDLANGKGDLSSGYKVKSTDTTAETMLFNGEPLSIYRVEMKLKKKLLVSLLVGLPDIESVTVFTADKYVYGMPIMNARTVIGYKLQFTNGTSNEMILNKYAKSSK